MNFILTDEKPIAATADGRFVVQAGVHEFSLRDGAAHGFHYVATGGHRNDWLRARRRMGRRNDEFFVFDLRHIMPGLSTAMRGNLERDVPGVITFTARATWHDGRAMYDEIACHVIALAVALNKVTPAVHA